jgi:hypothetical protein
MMYFNTTHQSPPLLVIASYADQPYYSPFSEAKVKLGNLSLKHIPHGPDDRSDVYGKSMMSTTPVVFE